MKSVIAALSISVVLFATSLQAEETNPIYQTPDAQSKFRDAQLRVKELMQAGRYEEAGKFMPTYQILACEAAQQKAGISADQGAAICASKNNMAGIGVGLSQQQAAQPAGETPLVPGITIVQPKIPGSSTLLDGSTPSIFFFDPRTAPRSDAPPRDPWTGAP